MSAYSTENTLARALGNATRETFPRLFAEAVCGSPEHNIVFTTKTGGISGTKYGMRVTYHNDFGPTCHVDDVFETVLLSDWLKAADETVRRLLLVGGRDPKAFDWGHPRPSVTFVPEYEDPIIHEATIEFLVDKETWLACRKIEGDRNRTH